MILIGYIIMQLDAGTLNSTEGPFAQENKMDILSENP
jgi:hypothetical protein